MKITPILVLACCAVCAAGTVLAQPVGSETRDRQGTQQRRTTFLADCEPGAAPR